MRGGADVIDLEAFAASLRARLAAEVPALVTIGSAEEIDDEKTILAARTPAAFVELPDEDSDGRMVHNLERQKIDMPVVVGLITSSRRSAAAGAAPAASGATGALQLRQATKKALVGFMPAGAKKPLTYVSARTVARLADRTLTELTFNTYVIEDFN